MTKARPPATTEVSAPRLPWDPRLANEFGEMGLSQSNWRFICEVLYPSAKTASSIHMVWAYCRARQLDPFKKPCHIVPVWNAALETNVDSVWPGIADLRTTATRTGAYAGQDRVEYGPMLTQTFTGIQRVYRKGQRGYEEKEVSQDVTFPEWAAKTVYRIVAGQRVAFHGDPVYWLETYAPQSRFNPIPNAMWSRRTRGQLAKCAEASALRQAFPEELGSDYAIEEMEGQIIGNNHADQAETAEPEPPRVMTLLPPVTEPDPKPQTSDDQTPPTKTPDTGEPKRSSGAGRKKVDQRDGAGDGVDTTPDSDNAGSDPTVSNLKFVETLDAETGRLAKGARAKAIQPHMDRLKALTTADDPTVSARAKALIDRAAKDTGADGERS